MFTFFIKDSNNTNKKLLICPYDVIPLSHKFIGRNMESL